MDGPGRKTGGTAKPDRHAEFLRLYSRHHYRIPAYIYTLVPHRADAEDLLQETSIILWEKFEQFDPGSDFLAWACQVAFWKFGNHRKRFARDAYIRFIAMSSDLYDVAANGRRRRPGR